MSRSGLVGPLITTLKVLGGLIGVLFVFIGVLLYLSTQLPDLRANPDAIEIAQTSTVYAADGSVLAEWNDGEDRTVVSNNSIPEQLKDAVVAIEDKRFFEHGGVDSRAIARALGVNTKAGEIRQGGSTITQQTVKLLFTDGERTITRKVKEALLALLLETRADKDEVLGVYLNTVYFGRGAYGVESASRRFFGTTTENLTLSQSALLAGCIQSPTRFDPLAHPDDALARRNLVLEEMHAQGYIADGQFTLAVAEPLGLAAPTVATTQFAPYFVEYVRRDLLERLGSELLYRGGLNIYTTLDPAAQVAAENAARATLPDATDPEVALVALRPADGAVVAVVGGRDFNVEQFDLATQGKRQVGSAFKPFVLAAALENGYSIGSTFDASPFSTPVKDEIWTVENYENYITSGTYTLEEATVQSINTIYARLITEVGPDKVVDVAKRMGITTKLDADPAIALGGLKRGVSPLEMASAFGTIANKGVSVKPSGVLKVTDHNGSTIYEPDRGGTPAISPDVAATLSGVLNQVYSRGTGTNASFNQWGAVKTGTAQSWRDAWTVGWSGDLCTAVWVGYPKAQVAMENVHGIRVTGGSFPATAWKTFMQVASVPRPVDATLATGGDVPAGQTIYRLCSESTKIANPTCTDIMELLLPTGSVSQDVCPIQH